MADIKRRSPRIQDESRCRDYQYGAELVGKRWSAAIMAMLAMGRTRFGELRAEIDGLSDRLLSVRLKELEAEGMVLREVIPSTPVQVRYHLTERGRSLIVALQPLAEWGAQDRAHRLGALEEAATRDERSPSGASSATITG